MRQGKDMMIRNPILPGFHPDPSICRAGDDYYIANSTFEWFPGVAVYHSRDLVHWRLAARPLDRVSELDMKGNMNGGGIWAPCLSHADGQFWLIYTDTKTSRRGFKDSPNYLVTAPEITGPWSQPVFLNSSGFDPSLFHDDDGRKWFVNMLSDHRKGRNRFAGIVLQEYSASERKLVGPITNIFRGTELGCTEGSHLYRRDGWYYLMTAEGGTSYEHAVTMGRSRDIAGPYEVDPENPILTSRNSPELVLQKAGHASLVEVGDGQWYLVHLCGRPITEHRRCTLGRETAIQKVYWTDDGWLRLEGGGNEPRVMVPAPDLPAHEFPAPPDRHDFDATELPECFLSLRVPVGEDWASVKVRAGHLRLIGRQTLLSVHEQSLIARRVDAFHCRIATCVEFEPGAFQQMAGLVAYYNTTNWIYLHVTWDEEVGKCLRIGVMDKEDYDEPLSEDIALPPGPICLAAEIENEKLQFYYCPAAAAEDKNYSPVGGILDAGKLSDDYVPRAAFTGMMVGVCCQDLRGTHKEADFDWFEYQRKN
jgi:xylan 1,4-beta-xylosidase